MGGAGVGGRNLLVDIEYVPLFCSLKYTQRVMHQYDTNPSPISLSWHLSFSPSRAHAHTHTHTHTHTHGHARVHTHHHHHHHHHYLYISRTPTLDFIENNINHKFQCRNPAMFYLICMHLKTIDERKQ